MAVCDSQALGFDCKTVRGASALEFDKNSLRFELVRNGGYVVQGGLMRLLGDDPKSAILTDNPDDLSFEVGKCSPL